MSRSTPVRDAGNFSGWSGSLGNADALSLAQHAFY
jgi:hypothetical protein